MSRIAAAISRFSEGSNCSQAILSAYGQQFGLDEQTAIRIATGFGSGMGQMAETCGAVTGAFMVLGLRYGGTSPGDQQAKEKTYDRVREFAERFKARNGSLVCRDLLDCDPKPPQHPDLARDTYLFSTNCPKFLRDACEIPEELLSDDCLCVSRRTSR
jgi:C_GCAxxG_C_C family probable redox protein